jgi:predicted DCC family thiol-disulfide oxidoreductase YuxK
VVLYDGVCGLCDRFTQFLLPRDRHARLLFAPLQSAMAKMTLERYGKSADDLDTICVVASWRTNKERLFTRSQAILHALSELGGGWRVLAKAGGIVPVALADLVYNLVAKHRYRIFGQAETCIVPRPEWRNRFLDAP